ncbi:hypothetical protein CEUSTIGMA_g1489.t1 [Chlamydomonas eustigma]|uniref:BING4 C-terminal domain-containing protein n=1 Tax=Chlamydomonas eustigma TaxID=1157962 RepID=A0A250WTH7_9CHLO|nr:hypothetical protein CEUSTIGMA_g1489.t1 [Chlamydomonas eustigma]|eukprot:GAX74039.1 hypothetical protein CEUSTIGMA_g1489.t1 [Chlamydomonas eustigma]
MSEPVAASKASSAKKAKKSHAKDDKERRLRLQRGQGVNVKSIKDKKLKGRLKHVEKIVREAQEKAAKVSEWLLPSDTGILEAEGIERTYNFKQEDILRHVEVGAAQKVYDLRLPDLGPYRVDFTRNGRFMLLGGRKGHLALMDWSQSQLVCEVQVAETSKDVCFLHNELFFAAAQKKYVYIYDKRGVEIHCLKDHLEPNRLQFLPHHFLLCSVGDAGILRYQDTSHGAIVAQHKTKLGPCTVMKQNPHNAVLCLGHNNGCVTMWTPNITTPVVKMLCHRGPLSALAVNVSGTHMVSAGVDNQIKVWDIRMMRPLHAYFSYSPAINVEISQKGLLAVGYGRKVQIWQDALHSKQQTPYMSHSLVHGVMEGFAFCPYEDVLGIGHSEGVSTMLVPGAGEPNFDSFVANPFQSRRERQEQEVHMLLDKLQPETVVLDPDVIGRVRKEPREVQVEKRRQEEEANRLRRKQAEEKNDSKARMKGKNRPSKRHRKKQTNVIEEKRPEVLKKMRDEEKRRQDKQARMQKLEQDIAIGSAPRALSRFYK